MADVAHGPIMIAIETDDGTMPLAVSHPASDPKAAVVVIQEAFGITTHIADVTRRLALDGFYAVAPALFHRDGAPVLDYDDLDSVRPLMSNLTKSGIFADLDATYAHLDELGFTAATTGVVGFCMGGSVALAAGANDALGACVTFYGGGLREGRFGFDPLIEVAKGLRTPWLGLFGDEDTSIPVDDVEALKMSASSAGVATEVVRYASAVHGFHCDDRPSHYHEVAAKDAWRRTIAFFESHLGATVP